MNGTIPPPTPTAFDHVPDLPEDGSRPGPRRRRRARRGRRPPLAAVLLAVPLVVSIAVPAPGDDDLERQMALIRAHVTAVHDGAGALAATSVELEGMSLEGGEATCFSSGAQLVKVTARLYGETYNATWELFFAGDALVFAFGRTNRYDTQVGAEEPPTVASVEDRRLYFAGERMIRCLEGPEALAPETDAFLDLERSTLELAGALRRACAE